jgi:hypothetical protein
MGGVDGTGGIVSTGGAVGGSGGTIVPGLAVFAGVPSGVGTADGTGAAARFNGPDSVAVDGAGNLFVADGGNNTIRKITPTGVVSTLAGTPGMSGSADGTGSAARFNGPQGVAVDGAGNVFVADGDNGAIRKVTSSGVVTTLARFGYPSGVAVDGAGNVFVADQNNHTILKITPAGAVTTLAGTAGLSGSAEGTGPAARFDCPGGVAVDGAGNVFVGDTLNRTIRKITPAGAVTTLAGTAGSSGSADGTGAAASFWRPGAVAVDGTGNVFVADYGNHTIRKITPAGVVTTLAGTGTGTAASFSPPFGVAVDGAGNVFVADTASNAIRKITPAGVVTTLAGTGDWSGSADGTGAAANFWLPGAVAVDGAGNVFVADSGNNTIRKVTPSGVVTTLAGMAGSSGSADGTGAAARFNHARGVAVDGAGNVFVADSSNNTIRKITPAGVVTTLAGVAGSSGSADGTGAAARFNYPWGMAVDGAGNVFVADNNTIRKVTPSGVVTTLAGSAAADPGSADGTGAAARFNSPSGVAVDGAGNVFVADNNTIRKVTPSGVVTTLAGTAGLSGSADGTGAAARFNEPLGVAVDGAGNLFVADTGNNTIRKISASGVVTTIVGVAASVSAGNFPGPLPASILSPSGVAVDASTGKLYITLPDAVMVAVLPN